MRLSMCLGPARDELWTRRAIQSAGGALRHSTVKSVLESLKMSGRAERHAPFANAWCDETHSAKAKQAGRMPIAHTAANAGQQ